jgi:hypothetical protein
MREDRTISKVNEAREMTEVEKKRIREAIARTDTEKFFLFTRLMKVHFMLKNARIIKN